MIVPPSEEIYEGRTRPILLKDHDCQCTETLHVNEEWVLPDIIA